jgi:CheY-like chemotaxis protein
VLRETLQAAAGERGLPVINAASGRDAFTLAHQYRPLAVIADEQLPDISGRDLLASLRCDFVVRETPVVLVSGPQLSSALAAGPAGLAPVLEAMESALGPRVELLQRLLAGEAARVPGWVEPVGVANLLRSIGAAGLTGYLLLRHGEHRNAVVSFGQGAICAVAVNSPQSADGPLAMLHLLGYEWHEYFFSPAPELAAAQPMGPLEALVETACRQNNVLLSRLYLEGIRREDQLLNYPAMDLYMSQLNQRSLGLFMQLGEGTPAADMAASGEAGAAALKALLFEMRRKAVIRPGALKQVRMEPVTLEIPPVSEAPPLPAAPPQPERVTGPQLPPKDSVPRHPPTPASVPRAAAGGSGLPRWLVALLAAAVTLTLAAGGYFIYLRLVGG